MSLTFPTGAKSGWLEQANSIKSGAIKTSSSDIPMLLAWLKDMNWPGAPEIVEYLRTFGDELAKPMATVLKSDDLIWIHWVLLAFSGTFQSDFWIPLKDELYQIAFKWDTEGAHVEALYILAKYKLAPIEKIRRQIEIVKQVRGSDAEDYQKIEALI